MKNIFSILMAIILLSACGSSSVDEQIKEESTIVATKVKLTNAQLKSAEIKLGLLEQKNISTVLKLNGKIDVPPQNMVSVSMPLGGYLRSTKLLPGMHLKRGEIIATMEDQQYIQLQQDYLTTRSTLEFTEAEFLRQKELNQSKATSDKVFQQTYMELNNQKIALSALAEKLKLININPQTINENNISKSVNLYSPIEGFVSKVNVNIGKYVNPTDILFELVNPTDIHLNLKVFEKDVSKLSIDQNLVAYTNNLPDNKHPCKIILISQDITNEGTAEVHCHFEDYDKSLLPGMYMNADVEIKSNNALAVDENAIVNFEGKNYVFIANSTNDFEMINVDTGNKENGFMEVLNGETLKDKKIVVKGAYTLLMTLKNKTEGE